MGLHHQNTGGGNNNSNGGGGMGNLQGSDLSMLHHHQQQQGISPMMNLHQDGTCSTSALQTLASVATSSHMSGLTGSSIASNHSASMMGLSVGMGGGLSSVSMGGGLSSVSMGHLHQQQQQQQAPIMTFSHPDTG
ncbi:unnamed protein product, partial [Lymnaea stagnalis]